MSRANPRTTNLGLPLSVAGLVALQNSVKRGFELIDQAIGALQGGQLNAASVAYEPDESNSEGTSHANVRDALDNLFERMRAIETGLNDSNSQFFTGDPQ